MKKAFALVSRNVYWIGSLLLLSILAFGLVMRSSAHSPARSDQRLSQLESVAALRR